MWGGTPFLITETVEGDGVVRLRVAGELDLATTSEFRRRLLALSSRRKLFRIDLSRLEFVDASGLRALSEVADHPARLQLDHQLSPQVSRLLSTFDLHLG